MHRLDITGDTVRLTTALEDDPFRKAAREARMAGIAGNNLRRVASIPLAEIAATPGILEDKERLADYIRRHPEYRTNEARI